ncbi:MAG: glycosyltransferase family 2 protein [Kiritimatiellia bacterium]
MTTHPPFPIPALSVALPVFNEAENLPGVLPELADVLRALNRPFEILCVDDASTDNTPEVLSRLQREGLPELRILRLAENCGQSAAFGVAFRQARHPWIVTLDADGQNDPADIPRLLDAIGDADICCGYRTGRKDTWSKRLGGKIANGARNVLLHSDIRDTGCSLKLFRREMLTELPVWKGAHRFFPDLCVIHFQARVVQIPVNHRRRLYGESKYTNRGRFFKTLPDVMAVRWMQRRVQTVPFNEI